MTRTFTIRIGNIILNNNVRSGQNSYMLTNVPEILGNLSVRNDDVEKQGDHGAVDGLSYYGARTIPVAGQILALTDSDRYDMELALRKQLALPISQSIHGQDGYQLILIRDQDGIDKQLYAKVIQPPVFELLSGQRERFSRFSFVLYAKDPKIYGQTLQDASGGEAYNTSTFTMQDGALPSFQDESLPTFQDVLGGQIMIVNSIGTYGSPPLIIIEGPTSDPILRNDNTGQEMELEGLTLEAGETVEIDSGAVTITKVSGGVETDASGYLTNASEWIFLSPGQNSLSLMDGSESELQATLEVFWRDVWI